MANEQKIDEIIDPKAFAQLDKLLSQLGIARSEFVGFAKDINEANKAIAKGQSFKDFEANSNKATIAMEKLNQQQIKTQLLEQKLADARAKAAADFEAKVQKEIQAMERKAAQAEKTSARERLAQIKLDQDTKKAFDNYEKGLQKKQAADQKHADQIAKNSRAYTILSNELERQRSRAQDLAVIYGENSKQFLEAAKSVNVLDTRLKAIDAVLGKNNRNFGNYSMGFNGLSNSINQLTREFPAFTYSVQTGFLALSNNLPIFFDQIKQTQAQIKAMRAEGQKVPGLFKQLAASIFSWGTALSLGVTLLTVYGKEIGDFISAIFKGIDAINEFAETQRLLGEAMKDGSVTKAIMNVSELRVNIKLAKEGLLDKEKVVKQYNETIGKTTGEVQNLDEAEKALAKNSASYIKFTLLKAAAQLALKEAANSAFEAEKIRAQGQKDLTITGAPGNKKIENLSFGQRLKAAFAQDDSVTKQLIKDRTKSLADAADENQKTLQGIVEKLQTDAAKLAKQSGWADFFGGEFDDKSKKQNTDSIDLLIQRAQAQANIAKRISEDETQSLDDRLAAIKKFSEASTEVANLTAQKELSAADLTKSRIVAIKENQANEIKTIEAETKEATLKLNQDAEKELANLLKDGLKTFEAGERKKIEALQVSIKQQQELLSSYADSALLGLAEQYSKGLITEKQYAQSKLDIQRQYVLDSINEEIKGVEAVIAAKKKGGLDTADDEKALADLRKKLSKETTSQQISDLEKLAEKEKELNDKKKELANEVANLGISIVNGVFENQKNKLQEQIDLSERRKQVDIENVNNSVASEEDKANRIAIIEARAAAQKQQLEQQQREIDQRKARFEKAMSISRIIANTAVGVTAALTSIPPNVPLSIVIGAIGLAQVAKVIADPIPKYQSGTEYSKEGIALTDEAGPEGYIFPDGRALIGSDKPNYKYLPKGTKVIPHHQLISMDAKHQLQQSSSTYSLDFKPLIKVTEQGHEKIVKALRSKKSGGSGPSKTGWYNTQHGMYKMSNYYRRNL